jgi:hypothetical protein
VGFTRGHSRSTPLRLAPIFDSAWQFQNDSGYTEFMEIILQVPEDVAQHLASRWQDLPRAALESLALESYRSGLLTQAGLRRMLGFQTRMEVDGFLKDHGVYLEYDLEDLDREAQSSRPVWEERQAELTQP